MTATLGQTRVGLMQGLVDEDKGVDEGLPVGGRLGHVWAGQGKHIRGDVLEGGREGGREGKEYVVL